MPGWDDLATALESRPNARLLALWLAAFNGLATVAVPTPLFLLSRHMGRIGNARPAEVGRRATGSMIE